MSATNSLRRLAALLIRAPTISESPRHRGSGHCRPGELASCSCASAGCRVAQALLGAVEAACRPDQGPARALPWPRGRKASARAWLGRRRRAASKRSKAKKARGAGQRLRVSKPSLAGTLHQIGRNCSISSPARCILHRASRMRGLDKVPSDVTTPTLAYNCKRLNKLTLARLSRRKSRHDGVPGRLLDANGSTQPASAGNGSTFQRSLQPHPRRAGLIQRRSRSAADQTKSQIIQNLKSDPKVRQTASPIYSSWVAFDGQNGAA